MLDWTSILADAEELGRHAYERTLRVALADDCVIVKLRRISTEPTALADNARLARPPETSEWLRFDWLPTGQVNALGLEQGNWLVEVRSEIEGRSLAEAMPRARPLDDALQLAFRLRDLHECGVVHGDVQPRNVVVDGDGILHLIDVSVVQRSPNEEGVVAGAAPCMAPELWAGSPPTEASDNYALATVVSWLVAGEYPLRAGDLTGWARAHREATPTPSDELPEEVRALVGRMLAREPAERPGLQALVDVLLAAGARADPPPVCVGNDPLADTVDVLAGYCHEANTPARVMLFGAEQSGKTTVLRRLAQHLELAGRDVILLAGTRIARPWRGVESARHDGPWSPVLQLLDALKQMSGEDTDDPDFRRGDRLHIFEALTTAVMEAVPRDGVVLLWDDLDAAGPDVSAWWRHFMQRIGTRGAVPSGGGSVQIVSATDDADASELGIIHEIGPMRPEDWNQWRATTLRTEVRDIAQGRWEQLVAEHGATIGGMVVALDRELGISGRETTARVLDTGALESIGARWNERVDDLMDHCAFGEVVETCRRLHSSLATRSRLSDRLVAMKSELLHAWTEATIRGGGDETSTADLEAALRGAVDELDDGPLLLARLLYSLGRHADGLAELSSAETSPEVDAWRAQLALSSGQLDEAQQFATRGREAVDSKTPEAVGIQLDVIYSGAEAIRGDRDAIEALRELSPELERVDVSPSLRARSHAYRALGLTRCDALDEATDAYLRALEEVESAGLDAQLPTYLLNAGTAYHRQGRLGLAREYYARGTRIAQPTTRASTRALLLANQANVDLALGRLGEARSLIDRATDVARGHELESIEVLCLSIRGDIHLADDDPDRALAVYREALDAEHLDLSDHRSAELSLACAEAHLQARRVSDAQRHLDDARKLIEESRLADLEHHQGMLRARLQWAEGSDLGKMAGIELFRRNLLGAHEAGNHRLVLRQSPHLVAQLEREELTELLDEISDVVRSSRNAIAMGLPRELRRDFFSNLPALPATSDVPDAATEPHSPEERSRTSEPGQPPSGGGTVDRFYRMLSLNEVILHADSLEEMLPTALDIALNLSHAERGFVLLRNEGEGRVGDFIVAASQDVGGESIPRPHLEVSRSIAEEAARTGRTVITLNAREDQRFDEALSVVDLDLTSVLCVPVRDAGGLLGALYLDHRFRPGVFEGEIPRMMEAFAHQLALAITNVRRLEALEEERSRLQESKERVDELLAEREQMVEGLQSRVARLSDEVEKQRRGRAGLREAFPDIAFASTAMERVLDQVERVARGDIPVVVTGESGVGKELVASAIHSASPRGENPFVAFNCGAVSESLFESELFGHVAGAFTGADYDRQGLFLAASGGTIFLDELGEMPPSMQVKLLRVLQEKRVRRVGASKEEPVDVRVVAATNRNLEEMVEEGTFREDLYYRLAALVIEVPPLRERREDIPMIAHALLEKIGEESGRPDLRLTPDGARLLSRCDWPGNVRELENAIRAASVLADSDELGERELAPLVRVSRGESSASPRPSRTTETRGRKPKATRPDVVEALRRADDDRTRAAEILGVSERTLYRYLKKYDLY